MGPGSRRHRLTVQRLYRCCDLLQIKHALRDAGAYKVRAEDKLDEFQNDALSTRRDLAAMQRERKLQTELMNEMKEQVHTVRCCKEEV